MMDWKDALAGLRNGLPEGEEEPNKEESRAEPAKKRGKLHVVVERKGRGGKTATIIEGFEESDEEIEEIARMLKQKLGAGGSSRGGEILIQGERKDQVVKLLREMGFGIKN